MSTGSAAISVRGLHKRYRRTQALDGLDFEIPAGQLTGFLGPNGAGKTTTFRCILGLTRPDAGEIEVLGRSVPDHLPEIVKKVGVIVEEPGLIPALSGRVNMEVAADTLGFGHDRIEELYRRYNSSFNIMGMRTAPKPLGYRAQIQFRFRESRSQLAFPTELRYDTFRAISTTRIAPVSASIRTYSDYRIFSAETEQQVRADENR